MSLAVAKAPQADFAMHNPLAVPIDLIIIIKIPRHRLQHQCICQQQNNVLAYTKG
jgi:hypothetical protein